MSRNPYGKVRPKTVNGQLTIRTEFYRRELWKKVKGIFEFTIPNDWDLGYTSQVLLGQGVILITDSEIGIRPFICTPYGINYMNNPTHAKVAVPTLLSFDRTLGVDGEIVFLDRTPYKTYYNFNKIIDIYAEKLASADASIDVNLINSRAAYFAEAETKAQAETIKKAYDEVSEGKPLVVYRKDGLTPNGLNVFFNNLKQNLIVDVLQDAKRTIMNEFLTEIGIDNANTDKRERLISSEVSANNKELLCNTDLWATNLKLTIEKVHKMFPELKGKFDIKLKYREEMIEENEIKRDNPTMGNKQPGQS